jgi:hypothetical protein
LLPERKLNILPRLLAVPATNTPAFFTPPQQITLIASAWLRVAAADSISHGSPQETPPANDRGCPRYVLYLPNQSLFMRVPAGTSHFFRVLLLPAARCSMDAPPHFPFSFLTLFLRVFLDVLSFLFSNINHPRPQPHQCLGQTQEKRNAKPGIFYGELSRSRWSVVDARSHAKANEADKVADVVVIAEEDFCSACGQDSYEV